MNSGHQSSLHWRGEHHGEINLVSHSLGSFALCDTDWMKFWVLSIRFFLDSSELLRIFTILYLSNKSFEVETG